MEDVLLNSIFIISLSIIVALTAGIFAYRKLSVPLKIMCLYTCFSTIFGTIISITSINGINNIPLVNIYSLIEFSIILTAYYAAFRFTQKPFLMLFIFALILVTGIYLVQTIDNAKSYNNALKSAISIIMVITSVGYLITQFYNGELGGEKKPFIVLSVGTFMYFSSSFLIVLVGSNNSLLSELQVLWIYLIHSIFYLIFVIILTFAFLICRKQSGHLNLY
jgi:hypothetical protein